MKVTKRNGKLVIYDDDKVVSSILKANAEVSGESVTRENAAYFAGEVFAMLSGEKDLLSTRDVRECVYEVLMKAGLYETAEHYRSFRK